MKITDIIKNSKIYDMYYFRKSQLCDITDLEKEKLINLHPKQFVSNVYFNMYRICYSYESVRSTRKGQKKIRKHVSEIVLFENNLPSDEYELSIMLESVLDRYIFRFNMSNKYIQRDNAKILSFEEIGTLKPEIC